MILSDKQLSPRPTATGFLYPGGAGDYSQMFDGLEEDGSLEDIGVGHASSTAARRHRVARDTGRPVTPVEPGHRPAHLAFDRPIHVHQQSLRDDPAPPFQPV